MKRIVPGILLAVGWLLLLSKGSFLLFWVVVLLIGLVGGREFCRMAFPDVLYETDRIILTVIFTVPILASVFAQHELFTLSLGVFLALSGLVGFTMYHYARLENPFHILSRGALGILFIGFLGSHLVMIHSLTDGAHWLIILSAITAGSDTCAYLVGRRWGRRKLCPHISPNKTIEGAIGGAVGGIGMALIFSLLFEVQAGLFVLIIMSFALSLVGMVGDLLESVIKRGTGTKDSGTLLLGHGGVLDRVDSLIFTAPVLYYILIYAGF